MKNRAILSPELQRELHKLIPNRSVSAVPISYIGNVSVEAEIDKEELREQLISKLDMYGLDHVEIDILVYRFVNNWSLREIAKKLNMPRTTADYTYHRAVETLKSRGYK